jgi:hypothetical protein
MERKLYRADLAELIGVKVDTLNRYRLPPRDGTDIEAGKARPYWWLSTAERWIEERPGRGARTDLSNGYPPNGHGDHGGPPTDSGA